MRNIIIKSGFIFLILAFFCATCDALPNLPTGSTGGANLLPQMNSKTNANINKNASNSATNAANQLVLTPELHVVTLKSAISTAGYAKYINCANGGEFVTGSLISISSTSLAYFCTLPTYPWYYTGAGQWYDQANNLSYSAVQQGLTNWVNPSLPSTVGTEQITTNAIFKNGLPPLTFLTSNCDPTVIPWPATGSSWWDIVFANVSMTFNLPGEQDAAAPAVPGVAAFYNNGTAPCQGFAQSIITALPGQTVTFTKSYSNSVGQLWWPPGSWPTLWSSMSIGQSSWPQSHVCSGTYTVQVSDYAQPVYIQCCENSGGGIVTGTSYTAPPSNDGLNSFGPCSVWY